MQRLVIIAQIDAESSNFLSMSDLKLRQLQSNPTLHFSSSGTDLVGRFVRINFPLRSSGWETFVAFLKNLKFLHVVDLGSFSIILSNTDTSVHGDESNFL